MNAVAAVGRDNTAFVDKQPIFDPDANIDGYELLFRDGGLNRAAFVGGGAASVLLVALSVFGPCDLIGLHRTQDHFMRKPPEKAKGRYTISPKAPAEFRLRADHACKKAKL
jgi:hypothetical protein